MMKSYLNKTHSTVCKAQGPSKVGWLKTSLWSISLLLVSCVKGSNPASSQAQVQPANPTELSTLADPGSLDTAEPSQGPFSVPPLEFNDANNLTRAQFVVAERLLSLGQGKLDDWRPSLGQYPLFPYLQYQVMTKAAAGLNETEVSEFLVNTPKSPLERRLRSLWLSQLAKQQDWDRFIRYYQANMGEALQCQYLQARWSTESQQQAVANDISQFWLTGKSRVDACQPLFSLWKAAGYQTPELSWRRAKLAAFAQNDALVNALQKSVTPEQQLLLNRWRKLQQNPKLDANYEFANTPDGNEFLTEALVRYSKKQPQASQQRYLQLRDQRNLSTSQKQRIEASIALFMAVNFDASAIGLIEALPATAINDDLSAWYLRQLLTNRDWAKLIHAYQQLTTVQQSAELWRYWYARALEQNNQAEAAKNQYRSLANNRSYYGFLAAAHLGLAPQLNHHPLSLSATQHQRLLQLPGLQRAFELKQLGRIDDAQREWRAAAQALPQDERPLLGILGHHWGWHAQVISLMATENRFDEISLRFPTPYRKPILENCQQHQLSPGWVYALMRQESSFNAQARSPAKAFGLMQLLPSTAKLVGDTSDGNDLFNPEQNIRYGTLYLRQMFDKFGHFAATTAAYNAGPTPVARWFPAEPMPTDIWVELIPYKETRGYVQNLTTYRILYNQLLNQDPDFFAQLAQDQIGG